MMSEPITLERVRHVASLARLRLDDSESREMLALLAPVLEYVRRLESLDLAGVEPLTHPGDAVARLDDDVPGAMLSNSALMSLAPRPDPPFVAVPKVIGEGGGA